MYTEILEELWLLYGSSMAHTCTTRLGPIDLAMQKWILHVHWFLWVASDDHVRDIMRSRPMCSRELMGSTRQLWQAPVFNAYTHSKVKILHTLSVIISGAFARVTASLYKQINPLHIVPKGFNTHNLPVFHSDSVEQPNPQLWRC